MTRRMTIKTRITLWYAALMVAICALMMFLLYMESRHAQENFCSETLRSAAIVIMDEMEIEHGIIEIDSDIDEVPNVYAALFDPSGNLIYGRKWADAPFVQGEVRPVQHNGHDWMILDTLIDLPGLDPIWMRLYTSAELTDGIAQRILRFELWLIPGLVLIALGGGYLLTRRALRPVRQMAQAAAGIAGGNDLSARNALAPYSAGGDELHALAHTLEEMLARLEASFEHERRFTGDAAHELRTPLNAMRTLGEYALSREDGEEKDEAIAQMLEKNEEMRTLVDQLLLIARLDAGQTPMEDHVDLTALMEEIALDMEPVAQERDIVIQTDLQPACVRGNRALLTRAVINLVDNAIRYGREGGRISMALAKENGEAVIRVTDDGEGLDEAALAHVFERFWRADRARSTQGTGIGLAIVLSAAKAHGGSAQAQSAPGEGCSFIIRLPMQA